MISTRIVVVATVAATAALLRSGPAPAQSASADARPPAFPVAATPSPVQPAPDMQAVLDARRALGARPVETLSPAEARRQPTLLDGMAAVLKAQGRGARPEDAVTTRELSYSDGPYERARIYSPPGIEHGPKRPVIVYFHDGGWVTGGFDSSDATPRLLSQRLDALVVSVDYRHAPEHRFGAQQADANFAYDWILAHVSGWRGDRDKIALAGEGVGAALAVTVAMRARDAGKHRPVAVVAIDPVAASEAASPSRTRFAAAPGLDAAALRWSAYYAAQTPDQVNTAPWDLTKADLHGLPPVTLVNAEIDPVADDGAALEAALRRAGVRVERQVFPGVTHGFIGLGAAVRGAYDAEAYISARLKTAFDIIYAGEAGSFSKPKTR